MAVPKLDFVLLFVSDPAQSAEFYRKIFAQEPLEQSPTFAMFSLQGVLLGLWSRETALPEVTARPGASELAFCEEDIDALYEKWVDMHIPMAQPPVDLDFGRNFVALDPDGHRIRIIKLSGE